METQDPKSVPGNGKGKEESVVPNPTPQPIPTEFKLAEIWLQKHKYPENTPYQIDIVAVFADSEPSQIEYFENVVEDK